MGLSKFKQHTLALLSVTNLQIPFSKKGKLPALSFKVDDAALVFVTGSNGIGKSTFLKQLSGSISSSKSIQIKGKYLEEYSLKNKANLIGFLEQHHTIGFPLLVKDLVVMGRFGQKSALEPYNSQDFQCVKDTLTELGVFYLYEKNFLTLSGGEQQLCLLAQLSLQDPAIILLDEPTQNLDLYNKGKVFDWMEKQVLEKSKIVVCVTHDLHWIGKQKGFMLTLNTTLNEFKVLSESLVVDVIDALKRNEF